MGWIIGILLLILAIGGVLVVINIGIASFPAWGIGIVIGYIVLYFSRRGYLKSLHSEEKLRELVEIRFDGSNLSSSVNNSLINNSIEKYLPTFLAVGACIMVTTAILFYLGAETNVFLDHKFLDSKMEKETSIVFAFIISTFIIYTAFALNKPIKTSAQLMIKEIENLVSSVNCSLKTIDNLRDIIKKNNEYASYFKIQFPDTYSSSINEYIDKNKIKLLVDNSDLEKQISLEITNAREDCRSLSEAKKLFDQVMNLCYHTETEVNKTGSISLIRHLDQLLKGIEGLKEFLSKKEWAKFNEGINFVMEELELIHNNACNFEDEDDDPSNPYRVLRVSENDTFEEITIVYHDLCKTYHPDKRKVHGDSAMKEINAAYEKIKKIRNIK